jgi:hypothetical protein
VSSPSPFLYRVALLLALMIVISAVDLFRNRGQAMKFREYGFVLIAGLLGALIGTTTDLITSRISPDYFIWGKGLAAGAKLRQEAAFLGMRVGFSAGVIGGAIALFSCRGARTQPPVSSRALLRALWIPLAGAMLGGLWVPVLFSRLDPLRFAAQLDKVLGPVQINRFREVWWIHIGLYAGLIVGLATMIRKLRKKANFHAAQQG